MQIEQRNGILTLNNTYQQVFKKAIHPTSKLTDCQKAEVYKILFDNIWDRKIVPE